MLHSPYRLTSRAIDQITGEHLEAYCERHGEYIRGGTEGLWGCRLVPVEDAMRAGGKFWYFGAVDCFKGLYGLFLQHIQPRYGELLSGDWVAFERLLAPYWAPGGSEFVDERVSEREQYLDRIRMAFRQGTELLTRR